MKPGKLKARARPEFARLASRDLYGRPAGLSRKDMPVDPLRRWTEPSVAFCAPAESLTTISVPFRFYPEFHSHCHLLCPGLHAIEFFATALCLWWRHEKETCALP